MIGMFIWLDFDFLRNFACAMLGIWEKVSLLFNLAALVGRDRLSEKV